MNARTMPGCYSIGEEIANSLTHALGIILSITGMVVLMLSSSGSGNIWRIVSCAVFGIALILLYSASTLYHAVTESNTKSFMRILDHSAIFVLIAATYTPFTLVNLQGALGLVSFWRHLGTGPFGDFVSDHLTSSIGWYFSPDLCCHGVGCCCGSETVACGRRSIRHHAPARRRSFLYFRGRFLRPAGAAVPPCHLASFCIGWKHFPLLRRPVLCCTHRSVEASRRHASTIL